MTTRTEADIFYDIEHLCSSSGIAHALAYLVLKNNTIRYNMEVTAKAFDSQYEPDRLIRSELNLMFGLLVKHPTDFSRPAPTHMQELLDGSIELLGELHHSSLEPSIASFKEYVANPNSSPSPNSSGSVLREAMFYGGESAYDFQYMDFSCRKYHRDTEWLKNNVGFTPEEANALCRAIFDIQRSRVATFHANLRETNPDEWDFLHPLMFDLDELVAKVTVSREIVANFLDVFSIEPAVGTNATFRGLSEFNEAVARPILRLSARRYVLFLQYSLAEALYVTPYYWMLRDQSYAARLSENRGRYVEEFSADCLRRVFGANNVHERVLLTKPGGERIGEIDVFVVYGDRAIIVQAKSKGLTQNSKRGVDQYIRDDFQKSVQDAYNQALLCASQLNATDRKVFAQSLPFGYALPLFKEIYVFCVLSEHYPALAFQSRQFLLSDPHAIIKYPFVVDVFFLDVMSEMLSNPLHFLSYANRRTHYGDRLLSGHELIILAFHLKTNLWIEDDLSLLHLNDDVATQLDIAMQARRRDLPGAKTPEGILTRLIGTTIGRIIGSIASSCESSLIDLGFELLKLSETTQTMLSTSIDQAINRARKDHSPHDITIATKSNGLTVHVNNRPGEIARRQLLVHSELRKYRMKSEEWFGLCISAESGEPRFALKLAGEWQENPELALHANSLSVERPAAGGVIRANRLKVGRNDMCPCGSGKKYKRCCLNAQ